MPERRTAAAAAPKWRRLGRLAVLILGLGAPNLAAQEVPVGDPLHDYARLLELTGTNPWGIRARRPVNAGRGLRFGLLPTELRLIHNSARPWGVNDGPIWQGRGATAALTTGIEARWGVLSAAIRPVLIRNENRVFTLSPLTPNPALGPWAYPTGTGQTLDAPQRFGDGSFGTFDLGSSYLRADLGAVALGISNESRWWGPGRRNSITLTDNAPGFGHAFLKTRAPVGVGIGTLSGEWLWGRLRESGYFDQSADNDSRFFTGAELRFRPRGTTGLEIGATRAFVRYWREGGPSAADALAVFIPLAKKSFSTPENPNGDDESDQLASLFFRWRFPRSGLEFYGEWGRGDHSWDLRDIVVQPEHASGWILGFQRFFGDSAARAGWRVASELTLLGSGRTSLVRPPSSAFYTHHLVTQGYTHRGQVLGAGIGPGSAQLFAGVDRFAPWGRAGLGLLRTVYDNNRYYAGSPDFRRNEVEPSVIADVLLFRGSWELGANLGVSQLMNQHYVYRNDELNVNLGVLARFRPNGR